MTPLSTLLLEPPLAILPLTKPNPWFSKYSVTLLVYKDDKDGKYLDVLAGLDFDGFIV